MNDNEIKNSGGKASRWEGPVSAPKSAGPKASYEGPESAGHEKRNSWEGIEKEQAYISAPANKSKKGPVIVVAAVAVVAVIGAVIFYNNSNSGDTTTEVDGSSLIANMDTEESVTYTDAKPADTSDTPEANIEANSDEVSAAETEVDDASGEHGFELDHDPVVIGRESYDIDSFSYDGDILKYEDDYYSSRFGIDVSKYQGNIDWNKVKDAGVEFAFISLGYRSYRADGTINTDPLFEDNLKGALDAGIDPYCYFITQAVNEEEAVEEAEYVIERMKEQGMYGDHIHIAVDLITGTDGIGRTSNLPIEQFVKNAGKFCDRIADAGFNPVIALTSDQWPQFEDWKNELSRYTLWYEDYDLNQQQPVLYDFLLYSNAGHVDGVDTIVDLDIQLIRK